MTDKPMCSFCDADVHKAKTLIKARGRETYICNECITECLGILIEQTAKNEAKPFVVRLANKLSRFVWFPKKAKG